MGVGAVLHAHGRVSTSSLNNPGGLLESISIGRAIECGAVIFLQSLRASAALQEGGLPKLDRADGSEGSFLFSESLGIGWAIECEAIICGRSLLVSAAFHEDGMTSTPLHET